MKLPTGRSDVESTWRAIVLVHRRPGYAATTAVLSLLGLSVFVVSGNLPLFVDFVLLGDAPVGDRLRVMAALYPLVGGGFETSNAVAVVGVALLLGVNLSMVAYHLVENRVLRGGSSAGGAFLGVLGAGCAACGSALLAAVFGVSAVAGTLAFLPFEGLEFAVLAGLVLLLSTFWAAEALRADEGCPI